MSARAEGGLVYLAMPFDLIPDFVPVVGYADDAIVAVLVLRTVIRRAGLEAVRRHWRGSEEGQKAILGLAGVSTSATSGDSERRPPPRRTVRERLERELLVRAATQKGGPGGDRIARAPKPSARQEVRHPP